MCGLDRGFELVVMRDDYPVRLGRGRDDLRRRRIAGHPQLHRAVVNRVCATQDLGARISRIAVRADFPEIHALTGLVVAMQRGHGFNLAAALRRAVGLP